MVSGRVSWWCTAACLGLGCGVPGRGDDSSMAGAEASGGKPAGGYGGQTAGAAGQATAGEPPVVDVTGRWGMIFFEDPIAVDIVQRGSVIHGLGCDAGLPVAAGEPYASEYCAPLTGKVEANRAWFGFDIPLYRFRAEVTVSHDASRMAGVFDDVAGARYNSSWLRLRDDERGLGRRISEDPPVLQGRYGLRLIESPSRESGYDPLRRYDVTYDAGMGLYGDLGAFYYSEISGDLASAGPILVGPVPATDPILPVSIRFDREASVLTHASVVDVRGVVSEFDVTPTTP